MGNRKNADPPLPPSLSYFNVGWHQFFLSIKWGKFNRFSNTVINNTTGSPMFPKKGAPHDL
jgi:hypothetical protein